MSISETKVNMTQFLAAMKASAIPERESGLWFVGKLQTNVDRVT